jgi:hypothetical protein
MLLIMVIALLTHCVRRLKEIEQRQRRPEHLGPYVGPYGTRPRAPVRRSHRCNNLH